MREMLDAGPAAFEDTVTRFRGHALGIQVRCFCDGSEVGEMPVTALHVLGIRGPEQARAASAVTMTERPAGLVFCPARGDVNMFRGDF